MRPLRAFFLLCSALITLAGCAGQHDSLRADQAPGQTRLEKGIALLAGRQPKAAGTEFNQALARTPSDANLHFLNGLAYREQARESGQAVAEFAETGFRLALEFDPGHWLAAWHLGLLQVEQRQYDAARKSFAKAAQLRPRNADIQLALAGSAYQSGDVAVALWAAENALALRADDPEALRIAAFSSAALGMESLARGFAERLRTISPEQARAVAERVDDWNNAHAQSAAPDFDSAPAAAPAAPAAPAAVEPGPMAPAWSECQQGAPIGANNSYGGGADSVEKLAALPSPCKGIALPRMAIVDITLIGTLETTGYVQGVNLLDGLKIVLGGSWSSTRSRPGESTTTISRSIGLPSGGISYSLAIFSAGDTIADVIARPSLLALDRTPSTFFSGSTVSVAIVGQYGGGISDKNIGVSLAVTPTFIDDERMLLAVRGARSFIEPAQFEGFEQALTATNNAVSANVIMRFGETLILSGLREREYVKSKTGVPLLRDIPGLQYLFSNHTDYDYARHILVLITPRKPATFDAAARATRDYRALPEFQKERDDIGARALEALRGRRPNLEAILARLQSSRYQHEFLSGDLSSRRFAPSPSLARVLQDLRQMIYF